MNGRDLGSLVLRIAVGSVMFAHGAQKAFGWFGGPGATAFVAGMQAQHVPALFAWLAILVEVVGGPAVLLGAFTRIAALGFAAVMLTAIVTEHLANGFFMNWAGQAGRGEGWEYPFVLLLASLALVLGGPGRHALIDRER